MMPFSALSASDTDGDWRYYYDYENALTKAEKYVTDAWATQGGYVRDAKGRRVEKIDSSGESSTTIRYYYDGIRAIEETEGADASLRSTQPPAWSPRRLPFPPGDP